jgi:hypothetical protein
MAVVSTTVSQPNRTAERASWLIPALALVGAPVMLLQAAAYQFRPGDPDQFWGAMELLYLFGWMSSIVALLRLNATGTNIGGRLILGIQLVALTLAAAESVMIAVVPTPDQSTLFYHITDIAWPLSHAFMLVVGIAVLVARVLPGWQRVSPLLCGLVLPLSFMAAMLAGGLGLRVVFAVGTAVTFALLAWAVRRAW